MIDDNVVPNFIQSSSYQDLLPEHLKTVKFSVRDVQPSLRAEPKEFIPDFVKFDKKVRSFSFKTESS